MHPRWHLLILLPMLLLSNLSARATCVLNLSSPLDARIATCDSQSCSLVPSPMSSIWLTTSTLFYVNCNSNKEYFTLEVYLQPDTFDYVTKINPTMANSVVLFASDADGFDYLNVGEGLVKSLVNTFTVYGSDRYLFRFNTYTVITGLKISTSQIPNCSYNFGEKVLKASDSNSATYQCELFRETINNPPYSGLGGCLLHRCQYYSDKKMVAFCNSSYSDDECYLKADNVWMIGTEYDLSSLPKVMIYLTMLIIYFLGYIAGFLVLSGA